MLPPRHTLLTTLPAVFALTCGGPVLAAPHDDFADAGVLAESGGTVDLTGATRESGEPSAVRYATELDATVWMRWTAPRTGWYLARTGYDGTTLVDVFRGETLTGLTSAITGVPGDSLTLTTGTWTDPPQVILRASTAVAFFASAGETLSVRLATDAAPSATVLVRPAGPGDFFADAIPAAAVPFSHTATLAELTLEAGEVTATTGTCWVRWTAPATGLYQAEGLPGPDAGLSAIWSGLEPRVRIYEGDSPATLVEVETAGRLTDSAPAVFATVGGRVYYLQFGLTPFSGIPTPAAAAKKSGVVTGMVSLFPSTLTLRITDLGQPPANDHFADAVPLTPGVSTTGTVRAAGDEPGEITSAARDARGVWYRWTAPAGLLTTPWELTLGTRGTWVLERFTGSGWPDLTVRDTLTGAAEMGPGERIYGTGKMRWLAAPGEVSWFRVSGAEGDAAAFDLTLRRLNPPANDAEAAAAVLAGPVPLLASSVLTDALPDDPADLNDAAAPVSVWWQWTAPATGPVQVSVTGGTPAVREAGGAWISSPEHLEAAAGTVYQFRVSGPRDAGTLVTLTLTADPGPAVHSPSAVQDLGTALPAASVPVILRPDMTTASGQPGTAVRWQAPAAGWYTVNTEGSRMATRLHAGALSNSGWPPAALSWAAAVPENGVTVSRILTHFSAGEPVLVQASAAGLAATFAPARVEFHISPAGPPPAISTAAARLREPDVPWQARYLEIAVTLTSPNGFLQGRVTGLPTPTGSYQAADVVFADRDRISGDAWAGQYRILYPLPPGLAVSAEDLTISAADAAGGTAQFILTGPEIPAAGLRDEQSPVVESISGVPPEIVTGPAPQTFSVRLAVSDRGRSGFVRGRLFVQDLDSLTYDTSRPEREWPAVDFGAAERISGNDMAGVYAVVFPVPAYLPAPALGVRCRAEDAAGNVTETWLRDSALYPPEPSVPLPVTLRPDGRTDSVPPLLTDLETTVDQDSLLGAAHGVLTITGTAADDLSGATGGELLLVDANGQEEARIAFGEESRTAGTALRGSWQVSLPIPPRGSGGMHYARWIMRDASDLRSAALSEGFPLPDRQAADGRPPQLAYFQISPQAVDLTAGPAAVTVDLGAHDDRPGITGTLTVRDSRGALLATVPVACPGQTLACQLTVPLPAQPVTGRSTAAAVTLTLQDASGRTTTYGEAGSAPWPDATAARLTLAPALSPLLVWWAAGFPGYTLPSDAETDTDHDGWPDIAEFALGTDPTVATPENPAAEPFRYSVSGNTPGAAAGMLLPAGADPWTLRTPQLWYYVNEPPLSPPFVRFLFSPAPWFSWQSSTRWGASGWTLETEASTDLVHWALQEMAAESTGDAAVTASAAERSLWFRLRVKKLP